MHNPMSARPNFIVIGPGKCGTTWIYNVLLRHDEVCLASAKETLYFEDQYWRGEEWYLRHFQGCDQEATSAIGEVSNTYIFSPEAAQRIYDFNPCMRIISCLRNPIDRTLSHFLFLRRNGDNRSFEQVLNETDIASRGLYYQHLQEYFRRFPPSQVSIFLFELLKDNPSEFLAQLMGSLSLSQEPESRFTGLNTLPASVPHSRALARLAKNLAVSTRRFGRPDLVTKIKYSWISSLLYRPYRNDEKPQISEVQRQQLAEYFMPDVNRLSCHLSLDLTRYWIDFKD